MMKALDHAIVETRFAQDIDVIVLTGSGDRMFCAGATSRAYRKWTRPTNIVLPSRTNPTRLSATTKLVIAAINGLALGVAWRWSCRGPSGMRGPNCFAAGGRSEYSQARAERNVCAIGWKFPGYRGWQPERPLALKSA